MTAPSELDAVFTRLFPKLVGMLSLYCGDRWVAEEIAQGSLARLWEQQRASAIESPDAWTYRVAMNLANSWLRRRLIERRVRASIGRASEQADAPDADDVIAVRAALQRLPRRQREAVVLRYYADLSVDATAAVMGCAPGTVKIHSHRALAEIGRTCSIDEMESADG